MAVGTDDAVLAVDAAVGRRWRDLDPLLPQPREADATADDLIAVLGPGGSDLAAVGACTHRRVPPGSFELTWGAAARFQLRARVAGPDVGTGLDRLLSAWQDHLTGVPGSDDEDTAAVVHWPSRDIEGVAALLRHGLQPLTVVAARPAGRPAGYGATGPGIRPAGPGDIDAVVALGQQLIEYDAYFGAVRQRPGTAAALRGYAAETLARPRSWTWLAERGDQVVGLILAEPPPASWIAPMAGPAPVAYLSQLCVAPAERGSGVGAALADHLHAELDAAGASLTLLHYAQLNPLSAPFWSRMGYRPLWTAWEARPARVLR